MTVAASLRRAAGEEPERDAYVYGVRRITYAEWHRLSNAVAANLVARGLRKGDRVAVLLPPRPEYAIAYAGAASAGLVTAGVNPRLGNGEIAHVLRDSGARAVVSIDRFGGRDFVTLLERLRPELPDVEWPFLVSSGDQAAERPGSFEPFGALLSTASPAALARVGEIERELGSNDPVAIVYTSGTTGKPKGALFENRNLEAVARTRHEMGTGTGELVLTAGTPFAHIGYMTKIEAHIEDRQTTIILDVFDARAVLETVARERVTFLGGVPAQWVLMLRHPDFDSFDLSSLRGGAIGGAPFTPELVREIRSRFGIALTTRYSCTEIALGTGSRPDDPEELLATTVGRAGGEVELRIVDADGKPLPAGEVGEVSVRSPAVMVGYFGRPAETRAVLDRDGWFHTGDLGFLDEHGYLHLRGRKKEMYIRGGYNVYPVEVEAVLAEHPGIAQVAVLGVPDPVLGEKGLAVVVPRDRTHPPESDEIRAFCREELADYKAPDFVEVRPEMPLNAMYKIDKSRLLEDFLRRSPQP